MIVLQECVTISMFCSSGRTRDKGVVMWKFGFGDYIDTYRSWDRSEERQHLRRLEEQLLSQDERMADEVRCQVALAMN